MASITIEWRDPGNGSTSYSANGRHLGSNGEGFDAILAMIRAHPRAHVILKGGGSSLGGQSLEETTPFADRFPELIEALGDRALTWDLL